MINSSYLIFSGAEKGGKIITANFFKFYKVLLERLRKWSREMDIMASLTLECIRSHNPEYPVLIFIVLIISQLLLNVQSDNHARGNAYRKSPDLYDRIHFLPAEVSPGNLEVVFQHSRKV